MCLKAAGWVANGVDPDQMLHYADVVVRCLPVCILRVDMVYRIRCFYHLNFNPCHAEYN